MEFIFRAVLLVCLVCSSQAQSATTARPSGLAALISGGANIFRNQLNTFQGALNRSLTLAGTGINHGSRLANLAVNGVTSVAKNAGNTALHLVSTASNSTSDIARQGIDIITSLPVIGSFGGNITSAIVGGANAAAQRAILTGHKFLSSLDLINDVTQAGTDLINRGATAALGVAGNAGNAGFGALHSGLTIGENMTQAGLQAANGILSVINGVADSFANTANSMAATDMSSLQSATAPAGR